MGLVPVSYGRYECQRARAGDEAGGPRVRVRFHAFIVHYIFIAGSVAPGYGHTRISFDVYAAEAPGRASADALSRSRTRTHRRGRSRRYPTTLTIWDQ